VDDARVAAWESLGVHTISLGVQSFDDEELRFLGRRHNGDEAKAALARCLAANFESVSIDFIFGLPTQSEDRIERLVDVTRELGPTHVSCYQLTVHEGTPFHKQRESGRLTELAESEQARYFERWHECLSSAGYDAYEVSNFAREPRYRSRHNQKYWRHVDYLGFGPSAHSFRGAERWWNERELGAYSKRVAKGQRPLAGRESLSRSDLALEALMLQLRTTDGIDVSAYAAAYGVDLEARNAKIFRDLETRELAIYREGESFRLTRRGLAVADGIVRDLTLPELDPPA
ncbi:MAG: coproporphyrinogen-III oxidase family protein, partial [Planctomycetota bacterium]